MAALHAHLTGGRVAAALLALTLLGAAPHSAPPTRIVSLVPAATEMLFAMGAGNRVVGVGSYDQFPPEVTRLPRLGGLIDPDLERMLSLKPDLAIVYATQSALRSQLDRAHVPMFVYVHRDLGDVLDTIRALGARVGESAAADALAGHIDGQMNAVRTRVAGRPRPRTLLVFGRDPGSLMNIDASGGYGFLHDMLVVAGGDDVLGDIHRESVQMSTEMILARAPEVIVELRYGEPLSAAAAEAARRDWERLPGVPAVRAGRVYLLVGDEFVVPGPRIGQATERLSRVVQPDVWTTKQ